MLFMLLCEQAILLEEALVLLFIQIAEKSVAEKSCNPEKLCFSNKVFLSCISHHHYKRKSHS